MLLRNGIALIMLTSVVLSFGAKPSLKGTDLLCNGESFFAASNICSELTRLARADGVLPANESFKQVAVSGVPIATVFTQFKNANPKPKFVVTDGGGIDLMSNNCKTGDTSCAIIQQLKNTMIQYIAEMKKTGVVSFLWMCYPDPQKSYAGALKTGQDIWAIVAKRVMDATTAPKPLWVDLRTTWAGHYDTYTSDGIHATNAGGTATAQAFWDAMKANDYAFFQGTGVTTGKSSVAGAKAPSVSINRDNLTLSLSLAQPSMVSIRLTTVAGRTVLASEHQGRVTGVQTIRFPVEKVASGVYCLDVTAGTLAHRTTVAVP